MPNRIIKESICTSADYASLSSVQRDLFIRLIVSVDDFGRYFANPAILRGRLFPLDDCTAKSVESALHALAKAGMVTLYEVDSTPYLFLSGWYRHQKPRAKESKFPDPQASANICTQMQADAPVFGIRYSDSINDIRYSDAEVCGEPLSASPPVILLPLNDKSDFPITQKQVTNWEGLYPAVDILQELRNMRGWLDSNPTKRKTKSGILGFVTRWLSKEQNAGGSKTRGTYQGKVPMGASGDMGDLERAAIERMKREFADGT